MPIFARSEGARKNPMAMPVADRRPRELTNLLSRCDGLVDRKLDLISMMSEGESSASWMKLPPFACQRLCPDEQARRLRLLLRDRQRALAMGLRFLVLCRGSGFVAAEVIADQPSFVDMIREVSSGSKHQ